MRANNIKIGAIYINAITNEPMRLLAILPCEGVWMETYDGQGYGTTIKLEDVHYASQDEVDDFLEDLHTYTSPSSVKDYGLPPVPQFITLPKV